MGQEQEWGNAARGPRSRGTRKRQRDSPLQLVGHGGLQLMGHGGLQLMGHGRLQLVGQGRLQLVRHGVLQQVGHRGLQLVRHGGLQLVGHGGRQGPVVVGLVQPCWALHVGVAGQKRGAHRVYNPTQSGGSGKERG
jgi:hypothetical protein